VNTSSGSGCMLEVARVYARDRLSPGRLRHSEETAALAFSMGARFGQDPAAGALAGLLHDVARESSLDSIREIALTDGGQLASWERAIPIVLHGRAAAVLARRDLGVEDPAVLWAIRDHVTGRASMGPLSRIVFAADFLEPTRRFLAEGERRVILAGDLDAMVLEVLVRTFRYLRKEALPVAEPSLDLYQELRGHGGT
jgi:predicted HD superfamily hydrolase involved in NAD metabolism